jgi:very-short-patch-repair endonuclease
MKGFDGICMMCRKPLLIVRIDGKQHPFCPECQEKVEQKTKMAMEKRGKRIRGKALIFPDSK